MASGLNGQQFTFNGYLPIDASQKKKRLQQLEQRAKQFNEAQLFIETPYRNQKLFTFLCKVLSPHTLIQRTYFFLFLLCWRKSAAKA